MVLVAEQTRCPKSPTGEHKWVKEKFSYRRSSDDWQSLLDTLDHYFTDSYTLAHSALSKGEYNAASNLIEKLAVKLDQYPDSPSITIEISSNQELSILNKLMSKVLDCVYCKKQMTPKSGGYIRPLDNEPLHKLYMEGKSWQCPSSPTGAHNWKKDPVTFKHTRENWESLLNHLENLFRTEVTLARSKLSSKEYEAASDLIDQISDLLDKYPNNKYFTIKANDQHESAIISTRLPSLFTCIHCKQHKAMSESWFSQKLSDKDDKPIREEN